LPMPELVRLGLQVVIDQHLGTVQAHAVEGADDTTARGERGVFQRLFSGFKNTRKVWLRFRSRSC
jgi:hypothetical protein